MSWGCDGKRDILHTMTATAKWCWPWLIRKGTVSFLILNNFSYLTYMLFYPWKKKTVEFGRWAGTQLAILLQTAAISRGLILTESQSAFVIETSHFTFRIPYHVRTEHLLLWPSKLSSNLRKKHLFLCL